MVKQIFLHEIAVALVVVSGKSLILIQVHGVYFLKAEIPLWFHAASCLYVPMGVEPVARPRTQSGRRITSAEIMFQHDGSWHRSPFHGIFS